MNRRRLIIATAAIAMLACAGSALGCTVCFGESDHPIVKGAEASVLFMVGVTYMLLGGGVASVILLRRRAKRLAEQTTTSNNTLSAKPQGAFQP